MAATYSSIRRSHLVLALRSLSRRQQTAIVLVAAILGPTSIGMMDGVASALRTFVAPQTPAGWRAFAWLAWLLVTSLVVLALREPVFMLAARPFLRMLPLSRKRHFACDVRSIAIAYSFLWLPIGYFLWATWSSKSDLSAKLDATFVVATGLWIAMSAQALALQVRASAIALAAFSAFAFCTAPSVAWPGSWFVLLAALALCGLALTQGYEHPASVKGSFVIAVPLASRAAAWSGLAIPVAWRDLRHAIGLRLSLVVAVLAAGSYLAQEGHFCGRRTGFFIVQCALAALAAYRVPALVDERLRETLPWLFRLRAARARSIGASMAIAIALFASAAALAAQAWTMQCDVLPHASIAASFGLATFAVAAAAFRWRDASTWIAMVTMLVLGFILGETA